MKSLSQYIAEALIDEAFIAYYRHNRAPKKDAEKFNFNLIGGDHAVERGSERRTNSREVTSLVKDCWSRIKAGIESGKYLINQKKSKKPGSCISLHSSEKTEYGYLTVVLIPKKYHPQSNYYYLEVVTIWKGKDIESWKTGDGSGKSMYHPEHGQLDMWDNFALQYRYKKDD